MTDTIKISFLFLLITLFISACGKNEKNKDIIFGIWQNDWSGKGYVINILKKDTLVLATLMNTPYDSRYQNGQVLFKDIKMMTDSFYVGKGLYLKAIYRTAMKKVWVDHVGGWYSGHDIYRWEPQEVFDHYENLYVDYRIEIDNSNQLICKPYGEGVEWIFTRPFSPEDLSARQKTERELKARQDSIKARREFFYYDGSVKRRDYNPPIVITYHLLKKVQIMEQAYYEDENGELIENAKYEESLDTRTVSIVTIYFKPNHVYDKVVTKEEKYPIEFWYYPGHGYKLYEDFTPFIKESEMSDSVKVFNALKKYLGRKYGS